MSANQTGTLCCDCAMGLWKLFYGPSLSVIEPIVNQHHQNNLLFSQDWRWKLSHIPTTALTGLTWWMWTVKTASLCSVNAAMLKCCVRGLLCLQRRRYEVKDFLLVRSAYSATDFCSDACFMYNLMDSIYLLFRVIIWSKGYSTFNILILLFFRHNFSSLCVDHWCILFLQRLLFVDMAIVIYL